LSDKFVQTPVLNIGYEEHGDPSGFPIMLLHGFPYDIRSWDEVAPPLAEAGYWVLVPYLRGYGSTTFLSPDAPRMAEQAAIAQDVVDFAEALQISRFATAGFDWGNRAACITSILHPELVKAQVAIGGYSVQDTVNAEKPASALDEANRWYQWYFNTDQGRVGLEENRRGIVRHLWETWSPKWTYTDEAFGRSAPSFDNPDFVEISLHSYRHRHRNAPGEERFLEVERELARGPQIEVPHRLAGRRQRIWRAFAGANRGREEVSRTGCPPHRTGRRTRPANPAARCSCIGPAGVIARLNHVK